MDIKKFRVNEKGELSLKKIPSVYKGDWKKEDTLKKTEKLIKGMQAKQELLYADGSRGLLIVFQAMDAGGKDSTIRNIIGPLNPQGVRVVSFKTPTEKERSHDFLWRIHKQTPARGMIHVFNRSHYEDVLIVKVKKLVPKETIARRYDYINHFEQLLNDEGIAVIKFYLHISKDYQKKRLQRRLDRPDKHWKFNLADLKERALWEDYQDAFEQAMNRCTTKRAPWYIIPAETRWFRNYLVAGIIHETICSMNLKYPKAGFNPKKITIM